MVSPGPEEGIANSPFAGLQPMVAPTVVIENGGVPPVGLLSASESINLVCIAFVGIPLYWEV